MKVETYEHQKEQKRFEDRMEEYRKLNETLHYQATQNYDKYLITLSAGALALSLTFLSTILKDTTLSYRWLLFIAWIGWGISICCILYSFWTSKHSHSITLDQIERGTIHNERVGGIFSVCTKILNETAGITFIIASISICFFIGLNMQTKGDIMAKEQKGSVPNPPPKKPVHITNGSLPSKPPKPPKK